MENTPSNPIYVFLFFFIRCIIPLGIMLGISYLLRKMGLISEAPQQPEKQEKTDHPSDNGKGGFANV
jgi:hypothetical protein